MVLDIEEFDDINEALGYIKRGSEDGYFYPLGIFIDGQPHIWNGYISDSKPNLKQEELMIKEYKKCKKNE
jgi:hypothetical protein